MRVIANSEGIKYLQILIALQCIKQGEIKAEYSGTIRKFETSATKLSIMKHIDAFLAMAANKYPNFVEFEEGDGIHDSQMCFLGMLEEGELEYRPHRDVYILQGLLRNSFYLATESNIQDNGVLVWGCDGLGAYYVAYNKEGVPFDEGITATDYLKQFPNHRVAGNDVVLCIAAADCLGGLINGWSPKLRQLVIDFREELIVQSTPDVV